MNLQPHATSGHTRAGYWEVSDLQRPFGWLLARYCRHIWLGTKGTRMALVAIILAVPIGLLHVHSLMLGMLLLETLRGAQGFWHGCRFCGKAKGHGGQSGLVEQVSGGWSVFGRFAEGLLATMWRRFS